MPDKSLGEQVLDLLHHFDETDKPVLDHIIKLDTKGLKELGNSAAEANTQADAIYHKKDVSMKELSDAHQLTTMRALISQYLEKMSYDNDEVYLADDQKIKDAFAGVKLDINHPNQTADFSAALKKCFVPNKPTNNGHTH
ncbi:hypothetical protein [Methylocystis sp.]|uniref:hypothetical protein n=1 Tax=Methylocystis sp. TaxID=1911079 RepID=UPI003DA53192